MPEFIILDRDEEIVTITLNRPEKLNAWHSVMRDEVTAALEDSHNDDGVRAVVLTGAGDRAFCAGQDLSETEKMLDGGKASAWFDGWYKMYTVIRGLHKPLICALNGVAAGSAFQVAMQADIRIAHQGVRMGQPEILSGIASTLGSWLMTERLGLSRAIELTLTGRMMDAQECVSNGLIHSLVPQNQVRASAVEMARTMAALPPFAMKLNKQRFQAVTEAAFQDAIAAGRSMQVESFESGEPQEWMRKFFEARASKKNAP